MKSVTLKNIPFPPSTNQLYAHNAQRRFKSKVYVNYVNLMRIWMMKENRLVHEARSILGDWLQDRHAFVKIDIELIVPRTKVFTKRGTIKKIDPTNRIKALLDLFSQIVHVDDRHFVLGNVEWVLGKKEAVTLTLRPHVLREIGAS